MDRISGTIIPNPSDLDVMVSGGSLSLVPGINVNAVQFNGLDGHITIATRGFEFDCFGDFKKCNAGQFKLKIMRRHGQCVVRQREVKVN
jgi:hypothetical protein